MSIENALAALARAALAPAAIASALLGLAACGTPPTQRLQALQACRDEVSTAIGNADWQPSRLRRVDDCMRAHGWRPSPGCVETAQQGTNFCEYRR